MLTGALVHPHPSKGEDRADPVRRVFGFPPVPNHKDHHKEKRKRRITPLENYKVDRVACRRAAWVGVRLWISRVFLANPGLPACFFRRDKKQHSIISPTHKLSKDSLCWRRLPCPQHNSHWGLHRFKCWGPPFRAHRTIAVREKSP